jgi:hypothetical protein
MIFDPEIARHQPRRYEKRLAAGERMARNACGRQTQIE